MASSRGTLGKLRPVLVRVSQDMSELGADWAVIGGVAMGVRCDPRFTKDLDVAVRVDSDEESEAFVHSLIRCGYVVKVVIEQKVLGRLATVRTIHGGLSGNGVITDFLMSSSGVESDVVAAATTGRPWPKVPVPVARAGHLVAMKLLAESDTRLQDRVDLRALRKVIDAEDAELARAACIKIEQLGTNRGKSLVKMLDDYLAQPYVKDEYEF